MSVMLSYYQSRVAGAVKKQGDAYNGPCPLCGGDVGKSDRFMVWTDKTKDIGKTCADNNISGVYFCRQCGASGDTISYLEKCEGMSFKEALAVLGISNDKNYRKKRRAAPEFSPKKSTFIPQEKSLPSDVWSNYAAKLLTKSQEEIWNQPTPLKWLHERGLSDDAIRRYGIGFLDGENRKQGIYRARSVLDLPAKKRSNGTMTNKIFIPRGIVISTFQADRVISLRFRRPSVDLAPFANGYCPPKYIELEGSASLPFILTPTDGVTSLTSWVIVESEFDAMLIHFSMNENIGVMAVRSNRNKPCQYGHSLLEKSPRILLAMDYEDSGAGVAAMPFWEETYPQVRRWPVPMGKDPGDAYKLGVDIAMWVQAGLPASSINTCDFGQLDTCISGEDIEGGGDNNFPVDVQQAGNMWKGLPLTFIKGEGFFEWYYSHNLPQDTSTKILKVVNFCNSSDVVFDWLDKHMDNEIGYKNLLLNNKRAEHGV